SRIAEDQGQAAHALQRLRIIHPMLASLAAVGVAGLALRFGDAYPAAAHAVLALTGAQVTAGVVNVLLSAPGWLQILHLALSLALWVALVLLIGATRDARSPAAAP
ncbi:MAG TPA: COX15/CtaA family protein, partial [Polyangiaceae bacterium]|nr:COX15/CtaA family protein [Polyangiaceae bacterium]